VPIEEEPVDWTEIPGSKFSVARDLINMLRDIMLVRVLYLFRVWTVQDNNM
jgi:dolichyl-phosphate beta-glucosyltransferase